MPLKAYPDVKIKPGGYTDTSGDAAANLKLSSERAEQVQKSPEDSGIEKSRLGKRKVMAKGTLLLSMIQKKEEQKIVVYQSG